MAASGCHEEISLIDLAPSPEYKHQGGHKTTSDLDLFDSLCTVSDDVQYRNIHLPEPLLSSNGRDPFDTTSRIPPHLTPTSVSVTNPPPNSAPQHVNGGLFYCQPSTNLLQGQHSSNSFQSTSSSSESPLVSDQCSHSVQSQHKFTPSALSNTKYKSIDKIDNSLQGSGFSQQLNLPLWKQQQLTSSPESNTYSWPRVSSDQRMESGKTNISASNPFRFDCEPGPCGTGLNTPEKEKAERAFDWVKDAVSSLAAEHKKDSKSSPNLCSTDETLDNCVFSSSNLPQYDDVPVEEHMAYANTDKTFVSTYSNNQFSAQNFKSPDDDFNNAEDEKYQFSSAISDMTWYGEFDDDDFDDEDYENTCCKDVGVCEPDSDPPPLPPRTYLSHVSHRDKLSAEKPYILPIKQDGQQLSHTHYFLIPPVGSSYQTNTNNHSVYKHESSSSQKNYGKARSCLVNPAYSYQGDSTQTVDYENLSGLVSRELVQRSLSNISSTSSHSSGGSAGSDCQSPRNRYSSKSRPKPIQGNLSQSGKMKSSSKKNVEDANFTSSSPHERIVAIQSRVLGVTGII